MSTHPRQTTIIATPRPAYVRAQGMQTNVEAAPKHERAGRGISTYPRVPNFVTRRAVEMHNDT